MDETPKAGNTIYIYIYNIGSVKNSWVLEPLGDLGKEKVPVAEFRSRVQERRDVESYFRNFISLSCQRSSTLENS